MAGSEMSERLERHSDLEQLSAWMDGELDASAAEGVARLVREDPAWRAAWEEFRAVDSALDLCPPVGPRRDLTEEIVQAARRQRLLRRAVRIAAPLAAAAAVIIAVYLAWPQQQTPPTALMETVKNEITKALQDVPQEDQFIVRKLSFFENYPEVKRYQQVRDVVDAETLSALAALESADM